MLAEGALILLLPSASIPSQDNNRQVVVGKIKQYLPCQPDCLNAAFLAGLHNRTRVGILVEFS